MDLMILAIATFVGAATIRRTGLGFALIASPFFVLVSGPFQGVLLTNLMTPVTNLLVLGSTWRRVEIARTLRMAIPAVIMVPVGAYFATKLPEALLLIAVGGTMVASLAVA